MDGFKPDEGGMTVNGNPRHIVCAANRYGDRIALGIRHHCPLMRQNIKGLGGIKVLRATSVEEQGFVDQWGNWVGRIQAMKIVKANPQKFNAERQNGDSVLFSEGLY